MNEAIEDTTIDHGPIDRFPSKSRTFTIPPIARPQGFKDAECSARTFKNQKVIAFQFNDGLIVSRGLECWGGIHRGFLALVAVLASRTLIFYPARAAKLEGRTAAITQPPE